MKTLLKIAFVCCLGSNTTFAQVCLNELMAENQSAFADAKGNYYDWVELYNSSNSDIDLAGYGLSDSDSIKFVFPGKSFILKAKSYLVFFASGNIALGANHLNFSLDNDGETVYLFKPNGKVASKIKYPALRKKVSYGRKFDGSVRVRYFAEASPEKTNNDQQSANGIAKTPRFSSNGGFFNNPFKLKISRFLSFSSYYYTLDGSEPSIANLDGKTYSFKNSYQENPWDPATNTLLNSSIKSYKYAKKIALNDSLTKRANKISLISSTFNRVPTYFPKNNIPKGQVVRAVAVKKNKLPSEVVSNTYFFEANKSSPFTFPIVALAFDEPDLFNYQSGIYVAGSTFDAFRRTNGSTADLCTPGNYSKDGDALANFEFFEDSKQRLNQTINTKVHGNCTRSFAYKSFRLYSQDDFGDYDLIRKTKTDNQSVVVLRNSGNDYNKTLFKDAFIHTMVKDMKIPIQAFRPSVVFINGEYWGIHNLRDRIDNQYLNKNFGADPNNVDMIKIVFENPEEIEYGDGKNYDALKKFFQTNTFFDAANYEKAKTMMDIENFIDFQIAHIFVGDIDWPQNNVRLWRLKTESVAGNQKYGNDGKWRWLFFDADRSLGETVNVNYNNLSDAITRAPNFIFAKLLQNQTFKKQFVDRFTELLNTTFKYENTSTLFLSIKKIYEPEIGQHLKRWNIIPSATQWEKNCQDVLDYLKQRPAVMKSLLTYHFGTDFNKVIVRNNDALSVILNDNIETAGKTWEGSFESGNMLKIKPAKLDKKTFSHWEIGGTQFYEKTLEINLKSDTCITSVYVQNLETNENQKENQISETQEPTLFTVTRGLSLNGDLKNERLRLDLGEKSELEKFELYDKIGRPISIFLREESEGKFVIIPVQKLPVGTYFYACKLKKNPEIFSDFITVEH